MIADEFYGRVVEIFTRQPPDRHVAMVALHTQIVQEYNAAVQRITEQAARQPVSVGTDDRTLAEVVAHIAAWERFGILAAGDILAGLDHPRSVTEVRGFVDPDGQALDFHGVHEFNAYQRQKYAGWPWPQLQKEAIDDASTFYSLFAYPNLVTAERLESTQPHRKILGNGAALDHSTMGWCMWVIYLEHEAVEHATELKLSLE